MRCNLQRKPKPIIGVSRRRRRRSIVKKQRPPKIRVHGHNNDNPTTSRARVDIPARLIKPPILSLLPATYVRTSAVLRKKVSKIQLPNTCVVTCVRVVFATVFFFFFYPTYTNGTSQYRSFFHLCIHVQTATRGRSMDTRRSKKNPTNPTILWPAMRRATFSCEQTRPRHADRFSR